MKATISSIVGDICEQYERIVKVTCSSPLAKDAEFSKVILRPILLKNQRFWQAEQYAAAKVFHRNTPAAEA